MWGLYFNELDSTWNEADPVRRRRRQILTTAITGDEILCSNQQVMNLCETRDQYYTTVCMKKAIYLSFMQGIILTCM